MVILIEMCYVNGHANLMSLSRGNQTKQTWLTLFRCVWTTRFLWVCSAFITGTSMALWGICFVIPKATRKLFSDSQPVWNHWKIDILLLKITLYQHHHQIKKICAYLRILWLRPILSVSKREIDRERKYVKNVI